MKARCAPCFAAVVTQNFTNSELWVRGRERRIERVLSARGLVLCFRCSLRARVICYFRLKFTLFFFYVFSRKKICVATAIMLFMDDKLDEEDVSMIFDALELQN